MADPVPFTPEIAPGLFTEATDRQALHRWKDGDKVRFHEAYPQKIGGWVQQAITGGPIKGKARRTHEWQSLDRQNWIAIGTSAKLYLLNQNVLYDITPIRRAVTLTNPFTTINGSPTVTVTDTGHDASQGDYVRFSGASASGGLTISGEYQIVSVLSTTQYTITASGNASSGATGGGTVAAEYDINNGGEDTGLYYGWGTCTWNASFWGTARGVCSTMPRNLRIWSLDNWGEDLLASPSEGAVYYWDRTLGPFTRATLIDQAPQTNQRILVSPENRQLVCLGANNGTGPDPLRIKVSNNEDFTDFNPLDSDGDVDNADRSYNKRIDSGSKIITGIRTRSGVLIFTDTAIHLMQPDEDLIYVVRQISEGNSVISPNSLIEINGVAYWMSGDKFMMFDGTVQEVPCEIWSRVFKATTEKPSDGLNRAQTDKVYAWYNDVWNEIWFHYPGTGSVENNRYAIYSLKGPWSYGTMDRACGNSKSSFYRLPYAISSTGQFFKHESGVDEDTTAGGGSVTAIDSYLETFDMQVDEAGDDLMHVSKIVPDNKYLTGTMSVSLKVRKRPEKAQATKGPYSILTTTETQGARARGRQMAIRFEQNVAGGDWRIGNYTFYVQPDGKR